MIYSSINNIVIVLFNGLHLYFYLSFFLLLFIIVGLVFLTCIKKLTYSNIRKGLYVLILGIAFILMNINVYFLYELVRFVSEDNQKSDGPNKLIGAFYRTQKIADQIKKVIPNACNAELITDIDVGQDPGAYNLRVLAYHLYPIDIRQVRSKDPECFIYIDKAEWLQLIPNGYSAVRFSENFGVAWDPKRSSL